MSSQASSDRDRTYDRDFLLSPDKRNQVMELWEVQKFGLDTFGNPDHVCIYGMKPAEWYGRGVRLLARTTLEAVKDQLGEMIGREVASVLQSAPASSEFGVVDPFAGSCNGLYCILRHLKHAKGVGFEVDTTIFDMTMRNIASLNANIQLHNGDYKTLLAAHRFPADHWIVAFLAPPWGDALDSNKGLDLARTKPPIVDVVGEIEQTYAGQPVLYVTQAHEHIEPTSLNGLKREFDWSDLRIYDVNAEGMRHGVLLGSKRWVPMTA
jgi:hypothetical protein